MPAQSRPLIAFLILLQLVGSSGFAEGTDPRGSCFREKFMWRIENYARGWVDLGPFRVGFKDPLPWEGPVERKWLNFWRVKTPKDLTLIEHGNRIYRKVTGAPPPEPKEPPKDADGNNLVLWRFDLFGGLDHNLNSPVVKGSDWLVEQGLLENPKRLTIPMLMLLSWPILALPRNGLHSLNQYLEDRHMPRLHEEEDRRKTSIFSFAISLPATFRCQRISHM